jgi:subtilisin family serine protease
MHKRVVRSVAGVLLLAASLLLPPALAMPKQAGPAPAEDSTRGSSWPFQEPGPRIEPGARERVDLRDLLREAEPAEAAELLRDYAREKGIPLDERPPMPDDPEWSVVLSAVTLNPAAGIEPSLQDRLQALQGGEGEVPLILQFKQRPSLGEMIELYELGLKGLAYERSHYARIVLAPAASLPALLEKPYLRWVGAYKPEYKVSPKRSGNGRRTAFIYPIDKARDQYQADLARMGIEVTHYDDIVGLYSVILEEERFPEAAELPWIRWIRKAPEEEPEGWQDYEPDDSRELVGAFETPRTGSGVNVGVRDNGIYVVHPDLAGIFVTGSESSPIEEHGTHVTGILAGRGTRGIAGAHDATGVAPGAQVLFRSHKSDASDDATNYSQDFVVFDSNSVQISNHSYWFLNQDYDSDTQAYDEYVDNDDMIIVKSAGNQGWEVPNTITNPGTGKNVIAVGAVVYVADANKGREVGDIAGFSSRGPTLENGRLKPELVAPGGQGDYADFRHGVVSCNDNPDGDPTDDANEWPEDDHYTRESGTSMAAPHVTGALALMKESYNSLSSEAAKARLIGGTIPLKNSSGTNPRNGYANTEAGFGLLNAYHAAGHGCDEAYTLAWEQGVVDYGDDSDEYAFTVPSGTEQLVAVMAYNDDAPDDTGQICDDLDLWLEDDLGTDYSYVLPTGVTAPGTVEKVIVESPRSGVQWTVHVAFDNPSPSHSQDYSLYVLAIVTLPELGLSASLPHGGYYAPGEAFTLSTTAENTGDWIVAGVTGKVTGDDVGGEKDKVKFYDSLVCNGDSKTETFDLEAPADWGPHDFTVTAKGVNRGLADDSVPLSIVVCNTTNRPDLVLPANGSTTCDATPTFDWDPMAGAASYRLQVDDDSGFGSPEVDETPSQSEYTPGSPLPAGYYLWRVRGEADSCQGLWSPVRSFTVKAAPAAPGLSSPSNGSETCDTTPYLTWNWLAEATSYQIQVDGNPGFTSPEVDDTISGTAYTVDPALSPDTYHWRVRAHNSCGWGPWSLVWSFTIPDTVNPPELYAPEHGSETCDTMPTFDWSDISGASLYVIQVDNNSDLGSPEIEASAPNSQYTPWPPLAKDRYYWRVRTYSSCGYGTWSDVHSFDVVGTPTVPTHSYPAEGSTQCNENLSLDWHSTEWASSYRVEVSASPSFGSLEVDETTESSYHTVDPPLSSGVHYWRVAAYSACGWSGWSSPWSFTAVEPASAPILRAPPQGRVLCDTTPTFEYYVSTWGQTLYHLQVDDSGSFSSPNRDITTPENSYTLEQPLGWPKYWYWRVQAENACGAGPWSQSQFRLTTQAPATPALSSPPHLTETCDSTPTFTWAVVDWTSWYEIQVDNDRSFGSPAIDASTPAFPQEYTPDSPLGPRVWFWRVRACNDCGCGDWSPTWDLIIGNTPGTPWLKWPSEDTTTDDDTPKFSWVGASGAEEYRFELDDDPGFGSPDDIQITPEGWYRPGSMADGVYFWRVRASNTCGPGSWSGVRQLIIDTVCHTPDTMDLVAPPSGSRTCDTTPTFEWEAEADATSYRIQLDNNGSSYDFSSPVIDTTTPGPNYTPAAALAGDIYYWRVRPCNACGCNSYTTLGRKLEVGPPVAPRLRDPDDGSIRCDNYLELEWLWGTTATSYEVQVDDSASFDSPLIHTSTTEYSYLPDPPLDEGSYYWRVRGCNDCGCGVWSEARLATIGPPGSAPALTLPADGRGVCTATPAFAWSAVSGTESYELQVDTDSGFPSPGIDITTPTTGYTPTAPLPAGTFYWRVQASNHCGSSGWSPYWTLVHANCVRMYLPVVFRQGP